MKTLQRVSLMVLCLLMAAVAQAGNTTLTWQKDTDPTATGYKIYQGTVSGKYGAPIDVGNVTTYSLDLVPGSVDTTYYFAVTAYDAASNESGKSNEVSKLISAAVIAPSIAKPGTPVLTVTALSATSIQVSAPPVDDGTGQPAVIDVRVAVAPALSNFGWGSTPSANCPTLPCTIPNLTPSTAYGVQAVAGRVSAGSTIFGPLSAVASVTTPALLLPPPTGLIISSATPESIVIVAAAKDCRAINTSTTGSTKSQLKRIVTCLK